MDRASTFLTPEQRISIESAIAQAEKDTSAELVVVLATRSGRYERAEDLFGLITACLAVGIAWLLWQDLRPDTSDWSSSSELVLGLGSVLGVFLLWFFLGTALAIRFPILARPFMPRVHMEMEVRRRGFEAFHLFRIGHTKGRSGVLIFVSLLERVAWVVGDEAINAQLPDTTWHEACRAITSGFKQKRHDEALAKAITLCTNALSLHFPRISEDAGNELPNTVRFMD